MGETTGISWCHHTFNPWIGCTKVSEACRFCYAERDNAFRKWNGGTWGPGAPRKRTSDAYWREPLKWNRAAERDGEVRRVFCASLADVFDDATSDLDEWREDLWRLIFHTPHLEWLLLTKRPQNILRAFEFEPGLRPLRECPRNVRFGASVENQAAADERVVRLLQACAELDRPSFLSMEPLLGPVTFRWSTWDDHAPHARRARQLPPVERDGRTIAGSVNQLDGLRMLDWIIAGGESGPHARPSHPDWFRALRDQCTEADVPFHFKQNGEWVQCDPDEEVYDDAAHDAHGCRFMNNTDGTDRDHFTGGVYMRRVGKKTAGRLLDGRTWDEFPRLTDAAEVAIV